MRKFEIRIGVEVELRSSWRRVLQIKV